MTTREHDGAMPGSPQHAQALRIRQLIRGARWATLATAADGQPHAALVTPAMTAELTGLLLLSGLSRHTRDLRLEPRCALMIREAEADEDANPQRIARVTLGCVAERSNVSSSMGRYLAVHPYAAMYSGLADFSVWQLRVTDAYFVGGFALAYSLTRAELAPPGDALANLSAYGGPFIARWNGAHADKLSSIGHSATGKHGAWQLTAVDTDGCELTLDGRMLRIGWMEVVYNAAQADSALDGLALRGDVE